MQPTQIATTQPATVIAKVQQLQGPASVSSQPTSYVVVDDQQPGTSRQLMFSLSPTKTVNPPSVAAVQQEENQHNTSGLSSLFGAIPQIDSISRSTHHSHFHSTSTSTVTSAIFHSSRTVKASQPVQPANSAQMSR